MRLVAVMLVVIVRVGATIVYAAGFEGGDDAVYERLYNKYYDAYFNLFRVATDNVLGQPPLSIKLRGWSGFPMKVWKGKGKYYAQMLVEIRADAFDKTDLSVDEIAQRLPWVWDDEATANGRATAPERSVKAHDEDLETPVEEERR